MLHSIHVRSVAAGFVALAAIVGLSALAAFSQKASAADSVSSGDLIRGETFSAVYYMGADGRRYVFPNEKTFKTWHEDFNGIKFISDEDLGKIQIGGNVTYKPGTKMIKINTDPKVYAVDEGGVLRWVSTEEVAEAFAGSDWNTKIDDVPDGFFSNYSLTGEPLETAEDAQAFQMSFLSHSSYTINDDKNLVAPEEIDIDDMAFSPIEVTVSVGGTVRFTNNDSVNHTATGDDGSWGTGTIKPGESFVSVFEEAGTYGFYCSYHPEMTGAVYVE